MNSIKLIFAQILLLFSVTAYSQTACYISPVPNSTLNNEKTNIIVGYNSAVDPQEISFSVKGSISGYHTGVIKAVENNTKFLFIPYAQFAIGDTVSVMVSKDSLKVYGFISVLLVNKLLSCACKSTMSWFSSGAEQAVKDNIKQHRMSFLRCFTVVPPYFCLRLRDNSIVFLICKPINMSLLRICFWDSLFHKFFATSLLHKIKKNPIGLDQSDFCI